MTLTSSIANIGAWDTVRLALLVIVVALVSSKFKSLFQVAIRQWWHFRRFPGPPHESIWKGNAQAVLDGLPGATHAKWHDTYGKVFVWMGLFSIPRISILDKRALHHILVSEPYKFPKSPFDRQFLSNILGHGLVVVEGNDHARQRKIMNPSFGPAHIKSMYPIFLEKALQFRNATLKLIADSSVQPTPLNLVGHTSRVTLDVIGAAGFGYEIGAIESGDKNELAASFNYFFANNRTINWRFILKGIFPSLGYLPDWSQRTRSTKLAVDTMKRIGAQIVGEKKAAALAEAKVQGSNTVKTSDMAGKDLLAVLIKANLADDLKASQKLSDEEVAAQISTFLLAGNETTATAINWAIYGMCKHPEIQDKLRAEIAGVLTDSPSFDEVNSLPYMDAVVRETLRVYTPIVGTARVSTEDCVIPLSEPIVDSRGVKHEELFLPRRTRIELPTSYINKDVTVWGPDAHEFRPERWLEDTLPEGVLELPSLASPTFLVGPRACIGFRFTLIEMKIVLFSLLRVIKFESAVPIDDIEPKLFIVTYPRVKTQKERGAQLPVLMTAVSQGV